MERWRHRPDHVVADEDSQHEDREPENEGVNRGSYMFHVASFLSSPLPVGEREVSAAITARRRGVRRARPGTPGGARPPRGQLELWPGPPSPAPSAGPLPGGER